MITSYVYWIAAGDRACGQADERRLEALRSLWRSHRVVDGISPFDGASFWMDDGRPHARVVRTAHATASHPVEVVDVEPSLLSRQLVPGGATGDASSPPSPTHASRRLRGILSPYPDPEWQDLARVPLPELPLDGDAGVERAGQVDGPFARGVRGSAEVGADDDGSYGQDPLPGFRRRE